MWAADHGSDWLGDEVPPDELNLLEDGAHYGWPYCWGERRPDWLSSAMPPDGTPKEQFCARAHAGASTRPDRPQRRDRPPVLRRRAVPGASIGGDAFIAQRGSWNRKDPVGYKVVRVRFEDGQPVEVQDFLADFLTADRQSHFGRIAGLAVANDGALLVSDDTNGVIYRDQPRKAARGRRAPATERPPRIGTAAARSAARLAAISARAQPPRADLGGAPAAPRDGRRGRSG